MSKMMLEGLPEAEPAEDAPKSSTTFASSEATLLLPKDRPRHPRLSAAAFILILSGILGIWNGYDYIDGDDGLITDRGFIYSQTINPAVEGTAIFQGVLINADTGEPAENYTISIFVIYDEGTPEQRNEYVRNVTDEKGRFYLEELNPGLVELTISNNSNPAEGATHRLLLSPPALFEPYGFTRLQLEYPSQADFDAVREETNGVEEWLDFREYERVNGKELYDPTAGAMYDMVGTMFAGLGMITVVAASLGWQRNSAGLVRMAAVTGFFSQGHYYSACCMGMLAGLLTIGVRGSDD